MPALEVLGRRWYIGSDDLVFPTFFCVLMRIFWVVILATRFSNYLNSTSNEDCVHPTLVLTYLATATALISLVLIVEMLVMIISMRGGIMQVEKRSTIPAILHFRLFLFLLEIGLCVFGTYWCFVETGCDKDMIISVRLVVISNWVLISLTLIGVIAVFDPFGGYHSDKSMNDKLWEKRFKCWCCCIGRQENSHGAFEDLARIFSSQFADVDLVASDIAVGLMMVSQQQHLAAQKRLDVNQMSFEIECERYDFENRESRETFQDLTYFSSYALGAYGWPLFMYIHPITGCFNLCQECSLFGRSSTSAGSEDICHSNHIALKKLSGLEDNDILYTHFTSNIYSPAFYVAVDHNRQVIIVTIRGTLSLQDVITDMVCEPQDIPGNPGLLAHRGMVLSASNIITILETDRVLEKAFSLYPEFQLLVLGHSLGAGAATLLSFMLRDRYPTLRCFAYGPPGGLLSEEAAEESKKFVVSTVVNKEFATRLSINSIVQLRDSVLSAIQINHRSKWKLTLDHIMSVMRLRPIAEVILNSEEEAPLILPTFNRAEEDPSEVPKLYPPGKVIFIHRNEIQASCCSSYSGAHYDVLSAPNNVFDTIPVSPEMLTDHLPDTLVYLLKELQPIDVSPGSHI